MDCDKQGLNISDGDILICDDGSEVKVVELYGELYVELDFDTIQLSSLDLSQYKIKEEEAN